MSQSVDLDNLAEVKVWAQGVIQSMERAQKRQEMHKLMMEGMSKATQPTIGKLLSGSKKDLEKSVKALESTNAQFDGKVKEAVEKMEIALAEERRKTELLRSWLRGLER